EGSILKADMNAEGIGSVYFRQLIFDGKRQHLARYPNYDNENPYGGGWAYAAGKRIPMGQTIEGEPKNEFDLEEKDLRNWKKPDEMEVMVFARYNWWNNICRVKSIDTDKRHVVLAQQASYPIRPGDRFYIRNAFEELDAPGEWYLDKETQTLYFIPPSPLEGKEVFVPTTRNILRLEKGTTDLVFCNLVFECSEGTAVEFSEASRCRIEACTIRNVGDYNGSGVTISGGVKNVVFGCDIHDTGSHGISLNGGDRKTLTPARHVAENNYIHHVGVFYKQGVGVSVSGVGQRIAHNLVHDGPRMAFMFGGNNHVFEYNHMRHLSLETSDTGAFYTGGRDWITSRGTVIRYNFMHDILGYGKDRTEKWVSPYYAWGVYLDDNAGGIDVIGNIALRCQRAGVHLHNGRDNRIENNIFTDCTLQQMECNGWTDTHSYWINHHASMVQGYEMVVNEPAWQNMRNMKLHPNDAVLPDKSIMSGNEFVRNIITYREPTAKYVRFNRFSYDHNIVDYNLVWANGNSIATGVIASGKVIGENVAPNFGFENGEVGKFPTDWNWQVRPSDKAVIVIDDTQAAEGKRSLRIDANFVKEKPRDNVPSACSKPIPLKPGATYKLTGKFKATLADAPIFFLVHYWAPNKPYWGSGESDAKIGTDWVPLERVFTIPKSGDANWHDDMTTFRITIGFKGETGSIFADAVKLEEVETLDEWTSWQGKGRDVHSAVADPLFTGGKERFETAADFRLRPNSPALKLGFKQIPVDKIGPYKHKLRATWPIVEAEGAREKPLVAEKAKE
ncbi:MAG: right-handed parallel beta-helix repeat-containing protein, partial [Planctomycetaceae bacterium]|nr:right-handed parallel beta-helix repeat-containing protein [Planctomycetaceae bacterium]